MSSRPLFAGLRALCLVVLFAAFPVAAADLTVVIADQEGEGFNDPTPVEPVGGNEGETLGAQRRIAFAYAASILASRVSSPVTLRFRASFDELACAPDRATLGSTAPTGMAIGFDGAPREDRAYPVALANALRGSRLSGTSSDVLSQFNSRLDSGDCLGGMGWYYGIDGDAPSNSLSFVRTAQHELTHGLGFFSYVLLSDAGNAGSRGQFPLATDGNRYPDVFSALIRDLSFRGDLWPDLSDAERAESLTNGPHVVWGEPNTNGAAQTYLTSGLEQGRIRLYAPDPIEPGSSISHWDTSLEPDQIMEPIAVSESESFGGIGLSSCVLEDIGWTLVNGVRCPDENSETIAGGVEINVNIEHAADADGETEPSRPAEPVEAPDDDSGGGSNSGGDSSGGGGGCTLGDRARFDPIWLVFLLTAGGVVGWRRRRI